MLTQVAILIGMLGVVIYFTLQSGDTVVDEARAEFEQEACQNVSSLMRVELIAFANRSLHLDSLPGVDGTDADRREQAMLLQRLYTKWPRKVETFEQGFQLVIDALGASLITEQYECMHVVRNSTLWRMAFERARLLTILHRYDEIFRYLARLRSEFEPASTTQVTPKMNRTRIVVVGAGPIGLASAIDAYRHGARDITVFEKRATYERNVWFDLYGKPWSRALEWLDIIGAHGTIRFETETHGGQGDTVTTVRAQVRWQ
jgi:hypothetical protein